MEISLLFFVELLSFSGDCLKSTFLWKWGIYLVFSQFALWLCVGRYDELEKEWSRREVR